jgi:3-methyladenine DNA glycosylase Tag
VPDVVRAVLAGFETPDDPRARLDAARARVARLVDADGIARTDAAIEAVWDEAEALAAVREAEGTGAPSILTARDRKSAASPEFLRVQN